MVTKWFFVSKLKLKMLVFEKSEKTGVPGGKPLGGKERTKNKNSAKLSKRL